MLWFDPKREAPRLYTHTGVVEDPDVPLGLDVGQLSLEVDSMGSLSAMDDGRDLEYDPEHVELNTELPTGSFVPQPLEVEDGS